MTRKLFAVPTAEGEITQSQSHTVTAQSPAIGPELQPSLLVLASGNPARIGSTIQIGAELLLGRAIEAGGRFDDHGISRLHAKVVRAPDGVVQLVDLNSKNGTFLNGQRVTAPTTLTPGDRVQIGSVVVLRYMGGPASTRVSDPTHVIMSLGVGIFSFDPANGEVTWSESLDRLLDLPQGTLSGAPRDLLSMVHPEERARVGAAVRRTIENVTPFELDFRVVVGAPAQVRWLTCKGDVLRDDRGLARRISGTVMDITERKKSELELQRQAMIFASMFDGIAMLDLAGRIADWNASAERMFGFGRDEALGKPLFGLLRPGGSDELTGSFLWKVASDSKWAGELELTKADGQKITCEVVGVPLRLPSGTQIGVVTVHRDVGERRQLEAKLQMADRLASVGTLAAGVAHEINNPLAYMSSNMQFLGEELDRLSPQIGAEATTNLRQLVVETVDGVNRIAGIVRDLKTFSRADPEGRVGPVDLSQALSLATKMADNVVRHRARIVTRLDDVPLVMGNESRLCQVFLNLLINAGQAIGDGRPSSDGPTAEGLILVLARRESADEVTIEIKDNGPGMPPEVQARIFDPFFTTKPVGEGSGLGLAICLGIVQASGGRMSVESQPGQGSTFRVTLKAAKEVEPVVGPQTEPVPQAPRRAKVLVIDDEPHLLIAFRRILGRDHDVTTIDRAQDARKLIDEGRRFDLILCDLIMPQMTGMELHEWLLAKDPALASRMVFVTGGAFTARATEFLEKTTNQKLAKPVDMIELRALVAKAAGAQTKDR